MSESIETNDCLVAVDSISKSYPRVDALAPLTLTIQKGERVALAGPSGSGKTTLLYLLAGMIQPDSGQVKIDGKSLSDLKPGKELARLVAIMHQSNDLVPQLSVLHNVLAGRLSQWSLFRSLISLVWPKERHLAEAALARLGIADKILERTSKLSGGEQQRVAIARLMVQSSRVILADEPVSSLDPSRAQHILGLLTGLVASPPGSSSAFSSDSGPDSPGMVLVASLHSPDLIRKYFSKVIGLRQGRLQFDMPASDLSDSDLESLYNLDEDARQPLIAGGGR
jgi:phosphonate transport system ATP-binding protein